MIKRNLGKEEHKKEGRDNMKNNQKREINRMQKGKKETKIERGKRESLRKRDIYV